MLLNQTIDRMRSLGLFGMIAALEEQLRLRNTHDLTFEDRLGLLVEQEETCREDRRMSRLLQLAKLPQPACIEDIDFRKPRGLDKSLLLDLAAGTWIKDHGVALITGATGTGKSYIASALAHSACRQGLSTRYYRFSRLLSALALARGDGSYPKLLDRLAKVQLLVLDDFGLSPLTDTERSDFLEVLEDRYSRRATLITSQLPLEHWHSAIGESTFADAILDRLIHRSHRVTLKGGSMRKKGEP